MLRGKLWKNNILELFELGSRRQADEKIEEKHLNIAALQQATELILHILSICSDLGDNLVYSGGVALNCKANRFIPQYFENHLFNQHRTMLAALFLAIYAVAKIYSNPPLDFSTSLIHPLTLSWQFCIQETLFTL